jgi:hypothetical protein
MLNPLAIQPVVVPVIQSHSRIHTELRKPLDMPHLRRYHQSQLNIFNNDEPEE